MSGCNGDDDYTERMIKWLDLFYKDNKSYPKFISFDTSTDIPAAILNTKGNNHDFILFYQDEVSIILNKSDKLKYMGYKTHTEDFPGIFFYKMK